MNIKNAHTNCEDEYATLWQMYGDLEDKCDRLREALQEIRGLNSANALVIDIAQRAIKEAGDE